MQKNWTWTKLDAQVSRELRGFLPEAVFDAHAHLYRVADLPASKRGLFAQGPARATRAVWRRRVGDIVGARRLAGGLFFPVPQAGMDIQAANQFVVQQLDGAAGSKALVLVTPDCSPQRVEDSLKDARVAGFKPYHVFSTHRPTFQAPLKSYLPEWAWELAHARGLVIMLHMVRDRALADPRNQREIRRMCETHPGARLVLAHAARGFHAPNTVRGLPALRGLQNVWFDSSGVCESAALKAILQDFGPRRLLWGSDFPVSHRRGKCVTVGDQFAWINPERVDDYATAPPCHTLLVGLESLRALREAADEFGLSDEDLRDVFCDNARRLLGLKPESGTRTQDLYRHGKERIPGGTQLLSKRPEMFAPDQWPAYFHEARGCETWDLDGRHYYDLSINSVGACLLGFRDPDVTRAVQRRIQLGSMASLNPPEEVELADLLCQMHPWAQKVRCARTGGEAAAVAIRIARATTDRSVVAICGYHGWHDWYLAANLGQDDSLRGHLLPGLNPLGVPRELRGTAFTFTYNNRQELLNILAQHGDRLAAVIMEPCRYHDPEPGFLEFVRDQAHQAGALLIFDEITIGFRLCRGGSHLKFGVHPDLALFAKTLSNGHPMAAVIGTAPAMEGAHTSFISSAYWTESVGPAAAVATLKKMLRLDVPAHVARMGTRAMESWRRHGAACGLPVVVEDGYPCLAHFKFDHPQADALRTLFTQLMLERGFLAGLLFFPTLAHTEQVMSLYDEAVGEAFGEIARALERGEVQSRLKGPVAHSGFRRLL